MSLTLGIVGLPNVGKSTLFNALTRNDVLAANYPFATIEPNIGVVELPDKRLERLAEIFGSERILPATVSFVDIAGIVKGASEGEGMGNQFLANIREADAICQVVRVFADDDVVHVDGRVDPFADIEVIETELILADLQTLEKAIPRLEKDARKNKDLAATLAAAHASEAALAAIRAPLTAMDDPDAECEPFNDADTDFHVAIAEASGNRLVADMTVAIRASLRRPILAAMQQVTDWHAQACRLQGEHHDIYEAIATRDGSTAAELSERHIRGAFAAMPY